MPTLVAKVSTGLGEAMAGQEIGTLERASRRPRLVAGSPRGGPVRSGSSPSRATSREHAAALRRTGRDRRAGAHARRPRGTRRAGDARRRVDDHRRICSDLGTTARSAKNFDDGFQVFGTCAGLILLATTSLDGRKDQWSFGVIDVTVRRNGYGRQIASFESDGRR